ncbi:hypothetical protein NDU88_003034 [Pleurodeles waltl]|uniref:Uncharacterized protein n=1 Tax=Pleurodeles waltl TaxID=8319 RepID=A0AAV7MR50_PLEWA|nr:hypothetical protein NDU88_003034 [Pleurodeles waltl]
MIPGRSVRSSKTTEAQVNMLDYSQDGKLHVHKLNQKAVGEISPEARALQMYNPLKDVNQTSDVATVPWAQTQASKLASHPLLW